MRGINKKIIEITDPEDQDIEKVIVFLKPGSSANAIRGKQSAQSYVAGLCRVRRIRGMYLKIALSALLACAAIFLLFYFL
ncbi:MAG: hypothetical protein VB092_08360 [Oscillospiraceae bacterium]|nr:hypothetical protein [Oscillospiraceae bacterium]